MFAPGRVNLIGEHTDYNLGLALPFAISEGVTVQGQALDAPRIETMALDLNGHDSFELADPPPARGWRAFVRGAAAELPERGPSASVARLRLAPALDRSPAR